MEQSDGTGCGDDAAEGLEQAAILVVRHLSDRAELNMGTANWADIFTRVGADPDEVNREFLTRQRASGFADRQPAPLRESPARPTRCQRYQQVSTLIRRQLRLLVADRGYLAFLVLLPFVLGTLTLLVPGNVGLGTANPRSPVPDEPAQILMQPNLPSNRLSTSSGIEAPMDIQTRRELKSSW